ncbi:MAG: alpha/beta hydrolase-fold protein [Bacteroidales bacterium]
MSDIKKSLVLLVFLLLAAGGQAFAQFPARIASPVVDDDRRATFSLEAPNAREVALNFQMETHAMVRDAEGVWRVTIGPLDADRYTYSFRVDGLKVLDPANALMQVGQYPDFSLVDVLADPPRFDQLQDVPHGDLHTLRYHSSAQDLDRKVAVYTPPGYDPCAGTDYPVLYLRHGGGGNETSWQVEGCALEILDNLLARGDMVPMVVVMTNGNLEKPMDGGAYSKEGVAVMAAELMDDVMPLVEKKFRVSTDPSRRAIAGLSMGGGQSFYMGLRHLEAFDWIGSFSSGIFGGIPGSTFDAEAQIPGILTRPGRFNEELQLLYLSVGEQDPRMEHTDQVVGQFREAGLDLTYETFRGTMNGRSGGTPSGVS